MYTCMGTRATPPDPIHPPVPRYVQEPQHATDVFSLRRIDLPATVLGGAAAVPTPRSARGLVAAATQAPAMVRTILHVRFASD